MSQIELTRKITIKGVEFTNKTILRANGSTTITTLICTYEEGKPTQGFQVDDKYTGPDSLDKHLDQVMEKMEAVAESLTGWQEAITQLEGRGFSKS